MKITIDDMYSRHCDSFKSTEAKKPQVGTTRWIAGALHYLRNTQGSSRKFGTWPFWEYGWDCYWRIALPGDEHRYCLHVSDKPEP